MLYSSEKDRRSMHLKAGDRHYRTWVGKPENYDLVSADQFNLMTYLGLRETHSMLDIGCGSLRGGRFFIIYLLPGRYFGIEPEKWALKEGIENELGNEIIQLKRPLFNHNSEFKLDVFGKKFDFILAQSIFSHAPERMVLQCLSEAKKVMKSTTTFVANFVRSNKDVGTKGNWVYPGCVAYTFKTIRSLLAEQNLKCDPITWNHPGRLAQRSNHFQGWQWIKITK